MNQKQISPSSHPNRNLQFEYLAELRDRFRRRHVPIITVDSKKRELVGNFKNPGCRWESAPRRVLRSQLPYRFHRSRYSLRYLRRQGKSRRSGGRRFPRHSCFCELHPQASIVNLFLSLRQGFMALQSKRSNLIRRRFETAGIRFVIPMKEKMGLLDLSPRMAPQEINPNTPTRKAVNKPAM